VVSDQVEAGRGHKRGEFFDKLERLKNDVARAVPPEALKAIQQPAVGQSRQPLGRHRRAPCVTAEPFQPHPVMSRDTNVGVHTEARNAGTTWTASDGKIFQIDPVTNLRYPVASPRAGGNASGDRSAVEFGEERLVVMERVRFVPIGLRPQTAAFKEPGDTALNALGHPGHFGIAGRGHGPENDLASFFGQVNAVQRQRMEMKVQI